MKPTRRSIRASRKAVKQLGGGRKAAMLLDVDESTVSLWVNGKRAPTILQAFAIQQETTGAVMADEIRPELRQSANPIPRRGQPAKDQP